jgi:hypothetical protein
MKNTLGGRIESITQEWCSEKRKLLEYGGDDEIKRQIVHALQKYVLNPPIKLLFAMGVVPPGYALIETTGRQLEKRRTPVGNARIGNRFWIVAEDGMKAGCVRNPVRHPRVRLKLREGCGAR